MRQSAKFSPEASEPSAGAGGAREYASWRAAIESIAPQTEEPRPDALQLLPATAIPCG